MDFKTIISLLLLVTMPAVSAPQTGYFIDAPVTGLFYQTSSNIQGITDKGAYQYNPGDAVTFYLGNDDSAMLLASVSSHEVVTPTLAASAPSRSINMTRLLLSLDQSPEDSSEILLASQALSDPKFQAKLKKLDLTELDNYQANLGIKLVSAEQAAQHLSLSQEYIRQHFTSGKIIFRPLNTLLSEYVVTKRDWRGNLCFFDVARIDEKDYYGPIGQLKYKLSAAGMTAYPSRGDYFGSDDGSVSSCELNYNERYTSIQHEDIGDYQKLGGILGCANQGCTRNDLNGFAIDNHQEMDQWKYRTVAMNYDEQTGIFMQKAQGLGPNEHVPHLNRAEFMWFTSTDRRLEHIDVSGIWQQTSYGANGEVMTACLYVNNGAVYQPSVVTERCPEMAAGYTNEVSRDYGDMWWLHSGQDTASLSQMNAGVKWYSPEGQAKYTSWEYLPLGKEWDKGLLYRLEQNIRTNRSGLQMAETIRISELKKLGI